MLICPSEGALFPFDFFSVFLRGAAVFFTAAAPVSPKNPIWPELLAAAVLPDFARADAFFGAAGLLSSMGKGRGSAEGAFRLRDVFPAAGEAFRVFAGFPALPALPEAFL